MALISCPECGKQISDTTPSCPHCGYAFSVSGAEMGIGPKPTKISETKKSLGVGLALTILGLFCTVVATFGTFLFLPIGILCFIPALALVGAGWQKITGTQEVYCPYCGKLGTLNKSAENYKCLVCKKRSVRDGEYLKPL